jgi:hypothetical protein
MMPRRLTIALVLACLAGVLAAAEATAAPRMARTAPPPTALASVAEPRQAPPAALPAAPEAAWTVLVYMDGDNDLERWVSRDIDKELAAVGSSADVQVAVLADRGPRFSTADGDWTGTLAFNVWKGMQATPENAVADWGERDMGSPQTLVDFVTWARESYPSRRTALFFWDHGWGWWPGYTMHDVTSNDSMDMDDIRRAMETVGGVDMVGMDTCLGQTIEVQATFRGFADALAASEDSIGYTGVDYARVLTRLEADPAMGAAALAKTAAASYRSGHDRWTLASSAVALDRRWDRLVRQVDLLAWKLRAGMKKHRSEYAAAYRRVAAALYGDPTSVDLYDAAAQLRRSVRSPSIRRTCGHVMRAVDSVVLYEWSTRAEGRLHGVGIYWPGAPAPPRPGSDSISWWDFPYYCTQLQFTRLTTWEDFLIYWGG